MKDRLGFVFGAFLLFTLLGGATCEDPVELDIDVAPHLVLVSEFSPQGPFQVFISDSRLVLEDNSEQANYREDVALTITGESGDERLELIRDIVAPFPFYQSRFIPKVGEVYVVSASVPDLPEVSASGHIPESVSFESNLVEAVAGPTENGQQVIDVRVQVDWQDPLDEENYYFISLFKPTIFYTINGEDTIRNQVDSRGAELLNQELNAMEDFLISHDGGALLRDIDFNGQAKGVNLHYQFKIDPSEELLEIVYIEFRTLSKEYYQFHRGLTLQQNQRFRVTPLSEPVIIPENIEGGTGIFAGYNLTRDTLFIQ